MSWQVFKAEVLSQIATPNGMTDSDEVADILADAYDRAIGRGRNLLTGTTIADNPLFSGGNKNTMAALWKSALKSGLSAKESPPFDIIASFGTGVIAYWSGAQMSKFPIPPIPTPPAIANIAVIQSFVVFPGVWTPVSSPVLPTNSYEAWLDSFILTAQTHLLSITGTIVVTAQYPPPAPPAPSVIPWTGYFVEPPIPGTLGGFVNPISPVLQEKINKASNQLSREEVEQGIFDNTTGAPEEESFETLTEEEYNQLSEEDQVMYGEQSKEEEEGNSYSAPSAELELSDSELKELVDGCIEEAKCSLGQEMIRRIAPIIPVRETENYNIGGIVGSTKMIKWSDADTTPIGYIDKLIDDHYRSSGESRRRFKYKKEDGKPYNKSYEYCAMTATYFWSKIGIEVRYDKPVTSKQGGPYSFYNPAAVPNWTAWAKKNGYWRESSEKPKQGEAIIYKSTSSPSGSHIGIVVSVTPKGNIITVEGNTSVYQTGLLDKKGNTIQNRGIGWKVASTKNIYGFIKLPLDCDSTPLEPLRNLEN